MALMSIEHEYFKSFEQLFALQLVKDHNAPADAVSTQKRRQRRAQMCANVFSRTCNAYLSQCLTLEQQALDSQLLCSLGRCMQGL